MSRATVCGSTSIVPVVVSSILSFVDSSCTSKYSTHSSSMFLFIKLLLGFGVTSCFKISRRFFSGFDQGKIEGSWSRHTLSPPGKCCPQIFVFGENSLRLSFLIRLLYSASTLDLVAVNGTSVLANFSNYLNILGRNSCVYPSLSEIVPQNDPRTTSLPDFL